MAEVPVQNLDITQAFSMMKENKAFSLLVISFALMFGFYVSLGNLISGLFSPFGLSAVEITYMGLYLLVSGILGAVIIGAWVDRTATYKATYAVLCMGNIVFLICVTQTLYHLHEDRTLFYISCCCMGFSSVSLIPLSIGFAAELTFPTQPAMVNGGMMLTAQLSAFI